MRKARPPSKPRKFRRKDSKLYFGVYWADRFDAAGQVVSRNQVQVQLFDEDGQRVNSPRKAEAACDRLYEKLVAEWSGASTASSNETQARQETGASKGHSLKSYRDSYLALAARRAGTRRSYETKLEKFCDYVQRHHGVEELAGLQREHIKQFLDARLREVKLVTVHGDLRALRAFLNEAVRDGYLQESPCKKIKLPTLGYAKASEGFFLPDEMDRIVAHCREHDEEWLPIFAGFRYAPFRREELTFLEWSDLDLDREVIVIQNEKPEFGWRPKRDGRTMDLHPALKSILTQLPCSRSFVFAHPDGCAYENTLTERHELGRRAWRKIKTLCETIGLRETDPSGSWDRRFPNGPHLKAFRSGISCELQLKGAPLAYVQSQLGHHDQSITLEHYTHLVPDLMGGLTKRFVGYLGSADRSSPPQIDE